LASIRSKELLELLRDLRRVRADGRRGLREVRLISSRPSVAQEGRLAAEELVEDAAERVDVGAVVDGAGLAVPLLGRHVDGRADRVAGARADEGLLVEDLGHAEVEHLHREPPAARLRNQKQVVGLEVAVDDARAVGVTERIGHGADERGCHLRES
jgi:hypothetical protein